MSINITVNGHPVPSHFSLVYGLTLLSMAGLWFGFEVRVRIGN